MLGWLLYAIDEVTDGLLSDTANNYESIKKEKQRARDERIRKIIRDNNLKNDLNK